MEDDLVGKTLSHYRVIAKAGAGGMGVVYRAYDTNLRRNVAIKVLPVGAVSDERARRRMREEALTLSRLNHGGIEIIHDFLSEDGMDFLVMEFIEGRTLTREIAGEALPEKDVIDLGSQIADALHAAHQRRVIHSDLKPGNIMVTPDRKVKVLDFGIAKLLWSAGADDSTKPSGELSGVRGTLPYMAPEQLLGERVDARTDIYALGTVLYEMATGERPFKRTLTTALIHDICQMPPPPPGRFNPRISPVLEQTILKCLEKDPEHRYHSALEVAVDLSRAKAREQVHREGEGFRRRLLRLATLVAPGLGAALLLALAVPRVVPFLDRMIDSFLGRTETIVPVERRLTFTGLATLAALSPDGKSLAYVDGSERDQGGPWKIMVSDVAGGSPLELFRAQNCTTLRWSPDGSHLACSATIHPNDRHFIFLIPRYGGPPRRLTVLAQGLAWRPDGTELATWRFAQRAFVRVHLASGDSTTVPVQWPHTWVLDGDWSPSGDRLVFLTEDQRGWRSLWTVRPDGRDARRVYEDSVGIASPRWTPGGDGVFFIRPRDELKDLCRLTLPPRGRPGKPRVILPGRPLDSDLSFAANGSSLAYVRTAMRANIWSSELRGGRVVRSIQLTHGTQMDECPSVSPDGSRIALSRRVGGSANIVTISVMGGAEREITAMKSLNMQPVWSPAGDEIAFTSNEGGGCLIWKVPAEGGRATRCGQGPASCDVFTLSWAPSDRILYSRPNNRDYLILDPRTRVERPLLPDSMKGWFFLPQVSPDRTKAAVYWGQAGQGGVWILDLPTRHIQRLDADPYAFEAGWASDGRSVYVWNTGSRETELRKVSLPNGPSKSFGVLSLPGRVMGLAMTPDESHAISSVEQEQSDVWLLDRLAP